MNLKTTIRLFLFTLSLHIASIEAKSLGSTEGDLASITKRQISLPGTPLNLEVLEVTTESIYITWSPPASNGGSEITNYRVQTEDTDTFEIVNREIPASLTTYNITDLDPLSSYNIRVAAINIAGRGSAVTVVADTLSLKLDIIFNQVITIRPTEVRMRWLEPERDPATTAPVLKFQINYTENDGPVNVIDLYPEDYNTGSFLVDYLLSVNPKSSYVITIAGFNVRGIGAIFNVPEIMTPVDFPSSPTNFMARPLGPHRVELTWDEPTYDGGCPIQEYIITFTTTPPKMQETVSGDSRSFVVDSLQPDSDFEMSIVAANEVRQSRSAVTVSGRTPPVMTPGVPGPPTITDITDTSATITWTEPANFPTEYELGYRRESDSEVFCTVEDLSKTLLNLDPQTQYFVRVRAINSVGTSDFSSAVSFTTFGAIVITANPEGTITTGQGQSITLQCTLEGSQAGDNIQYQWTKDGTDIPSGIQTNGGTLTISDPQPSLSGEYTCTAVQQQISGSHQLTIVPGIPGSPSNVRAEVEGETVTILWDEGPSNGADVTFTVTISLNDQQVHQVTSMTGSLSVGRGDFQEEDDARRETDYVVIVVAANSAGDSGDTSATITLPSALPGAVGNIRVDIEGDTLTLRWDAPTINGNNIVLYMVEVLLESEQVYSTMASGTSFSVSRNDIQEAGDIVRTRNTQYTVVVVARNERGDSAETSQTFTVPAESAAPPESAVSMVVLTALLVPSLSLAMH